MGRTQQVALAGATLEIVGREDFVAMKAFAGGPLDLSDARANGPSGAVLLAGSLGENGAAANDEDLGLATPHSVATVRAPV